MAVLVEGISVIIRREAIAEKFPGGWYAFEHDVPNRTLCADDKLARVGFMSPEDVKSYVEHLEKHGFFYLKNGKAIDLVVVDQIRGLAAGCDWVEFGHVQIDGSCDKRVATCQTVDGGVKTLFTPEGWKFENSLSQRFGFVPSGQGEKTLKFLRHENGVDVYMDLITNEEIYIGRTGGKGT